MEEPIPPGTPVSAERIHTCSARTVQQGEEWPAVVLFNAPCPVVRADCLGSDVVGHTLETVLVGGDYVPCIKSEG